MKTVLLSSQKIGHAGGRQLIISSNINTDAPYWVFAVIWPSLTSGTSALSCTIYTKGTLLPNVRKRVYSIMGNQFIISSPYLYQLQGGFLEMFVSSAVCRHHSRFLTPKHINEVHNVKVERSSNLCIIFHSIRSNNKSEDWNRADVCPLGRRFRSYNIRNIGNNPINALAAGFREWFYTKDWKFVRTS